MPKHVTTPHELIRAVMEGNSRAKARLARMGEPAVRPLLEALVGGHGRVGDALPELVDVLERIARNDVDALIPALKSHPAVNLVVWAVGHGSVKHGKVHREAHAALRRLRRHKDSAVRSVAAHHLDRIDRATTKKRATTRKRAAPKRKVRAK